MLKVLYSQWNQTPESLYQAGLSAPHPRTRQRLMALYRICKNESAEAVAHSIGRDPRSVRAWLKKYNKFGPEALHYRRTGGRPPFVEWLSQS